MKNHPPWPLSNSFLALSMFDKGVMIVNIRISPFKTNVDGTVKSPSLDFLLTETEKCDFRFPYKSKGCKTPH
jgi:hypothetical protein